jgi:nicotinamidase-related amidase
MNKKSQPVFKNKDNGVSPRYTILVMDMLNDFIYGRLKSVRASKIIPKIKYLLIFARRKNIPIFYCNDEHLSSDPEIRVWGAHAMKGTKGADVIQDIKPTYNDLMIPKRGYSAFDKSRLERALKSTYNGKGPTTIIMTGIHTHICIKHSTYDAFTRGYDTIIAEDGVNAFTKNDHIFGLEYMKANYGTKIKKISEIIRDINQQSKL